MNVFLATYVLCVNSNLKSCSVELAFPESYIHLVMKSASLKINNLFDIATQPDIKL